MTREYELALVLSPVLGEEGIQSTKEKISALISSNATIKNVDEWGMRKLAYEIDDQKEGFYTFVKFTSGPDFPSELERVLKITSGVLRFLVIREDA